MKMKRNRREEQKQKRMKRKRGRLRNQDYEKGKQINRWPMDTDQPTFDNNSEDRWLMSMTHSGELWGWLDHILRHKHADINIQIGTQSCPGNKTNNDADSELPCKSQNVCILNGISILLSALPRNCREHWSLWPEYKDLVRAKIYLY